jgi:hypothetical protein
MMVPSSNNNALQWVYFLLAAFKERFIVGILSLLDQSWMKIGDPFLVYFICLLCSPKGVENEDTWTKGSGTIDTKYSTTLNLCTSHLQGKAFRMRVVGRSWGRR